MRVFLGIFLCLSLISCDRSYAPNENHADGFDSLRQEAYPNPDSTFNVENYTHIDVGSVIVHLVDSSNVSISVPDIGHYGAKITAAPTSCLIHGYPLLYSTPTWVSIDSHHSVHATWTTNVIVIDESEEN